MRAVISRPRRQTVRTGTLQSILDQANVTSVKLMKMDIEGGEWAVARDLRSYSGRFAIILAELHPRWAGADDTTAMYECLSSGRSLCVVDVSGRRLMPIVSADEFQKHLELYYFVSSDADAAERLTGFTW